jgi:hypothetical protein
LFAGSRQQIKEKGGDENRSDEDGSGGKPRERPRPFCDGHTCGGKAAAFEKYVHTSYSGFLFLFIFSGKPSEPGQDSKTRSPLAFDPEQIVLAAKMGVPAFTDFVQANCLHRFTDVDDLSTCLGLFSDAAMFFDPKFGFKVLSHLVVMLCDVFDSVRRWQ